MTLGFKQYFPWHTEKNPAPTYFKEKILAGVGLSSFDHNGKEYLLDTIKYNKMNEYEGKESNLNPGYTPKLHTIREGSRWKAGDLMHMATGVRTKNYQQFNKGIPELERVKSVQGIRMEWVERDDQPMGCPAKTMIIHIDGKEFGQIDHLGPIITHKPSGKKFINNDGFDEVEEFLRWFDKDFTGQIIHWTDLKY